MWLSSFQGLVTTCILLGFAFFLTGVQPLSMASRTFPAI
jgi:hypothetical protein